jgi:hypothetical protein
MFKYGEGFDLYGHNGMYLTGGWKHRPYGGKSFPNHPGGTAGYRGNGYEFFITGVEPDPRQGYKRPGCPNIYYYGPEQVGIFGNHMHGDGRVQPSHGGDALSVMDRVEGVNAPG